MFFTVFCIFFKLIICKSIIQKYVVQQPDGIRRTNKSHFLERDQEQTVSQLRCASVILNKKQNKSLVFFIKYVLRFAVRILMMYGLEQVWNIGTALFRLSPNLIFVHIRLKSEIEHGKT